jgi:signal transduction histidine kinase
MDADALFLRYQELQRYVGWTAEDAAHIQAAAPILESHFGPLIEDFYAEIKRHPEARKVITGGAEQIAKLKGTLLGWLHDLVTGPYDAAYVAKRWRVGWRHVEIGLDQVFTNVALSRMRRGLLQILEEHGDDPGATRRSLNTLLDLDLAIIEGAYQTEYTLLQHKQAEERALQAERLAAIGQMVTGLAHESGNALARSQACLEMLSWEVPDRPAALDLIARIQKAQDHLQQLYEEVRNYAAPFKLDREVWDIRSIWRQAWENLSMKRQDRKTSLAEETGGVDLKCAVDQFSMEQVFRNIFENSLAACGDPVAMVIMVTAASLGTRPALQIGVRDNGPGLTPEQKRRIFEPFFTTKTKGTGLGMAITKRIVEAHAGHIEVGSSGPGAEIVITLPRDAR